MLLQNKSQPLTPSRPQLKGPSAFEMVLCKINSSITVKCNHFHYLEIRKNTSFLISLLREPFKQFHKEKNVLPRIFLSMASTVSADAED